MTSASIYLILPLLLVAFQYHFPAAVVPLDRLSPGNHHYPRVLGRAGFLHFIRNRAQLPATNHSCVDVHQCGLWACTWLAACFAVRRL